MKKIINRMASGLNKIISFAKDVIDVLFKQLLVLSVIVAVIILIIAAFSNIKILIALLILTMFGLLVYALGDE